MFFLSAGIVLTPQWGTRNFHKTTTESVFFFKYSRRGQAFCVGSLHVTAVWMLQCWTSTFHIDLLRGFCERYPAWYSQKKMRTGTWPWIYSDDLPSYNMVDFYSYVNVYQRVETPVILHVFFPHGFLQWKIWSVGPPMSCSPRRWVPVKMVSCWKRAEPQIKDVNMPQKAPKWQIKNHQNYRYTW